MARLNEPPAVAPQPSAETIEAVKRRFLRQNRELAKTNSQQSVRIRNLECEGSRLLAENLSLREQVLQLQNALETQSNRPSFEKIDAVKARLEAKLEEFGIMIADLGNMKDTNNAPRCKSQLAATRRSPDERQWRSGLGLQDVENAMLPTIAEDKYYPRRTMNADELQNILYDPDGQSPDLGPPPVSRFENEEPISFNPSPESNHVQDEPLDDPEPALSINLETRKKRRESGPKLNYHSIAEFDFLPDETEQRPKTVRAGAKRKFSVQEDEKAEPQKESFHFSRRNGANAGVDATSTTDVQKETRSRSPERPILGNKPVNTDPVLSPKKQCSSVSDKPDTKPSVTKSTRGRLTITRSAQPELDHLPASVLIANIHLDALPPKTPAVEDIFSPPSTQPSTSRPESKDTPPPGDLSSNDQAGAGARPSRRARPQVSYKEPSLTAKMRRPGKELVNAVVPAHERTANVEPPPTVIKRELIEGSASWKSLPVAPGHSADEVEAGSPLRDKLDRREANPPIETTVEAPRLNSSAASNAISALIAGTSIARRKTPVPGPVDIPSEQTRLQPRLSVPDVDDDEMKTTDTEGKDKDGLAIFDFNESSPIESSTTSRPRIDLAKVTNNARRHSSIPGLSTGEEKRPEIKPKANTNLSSFHSRTGSGGGVKSASASNLTRSASISKTSVKDKKVGALPVSNSSVDLKAVATASGTGNLRAERAASRRKSMML